MGSSEWCRQLLNHEKRHWWGRKREKVMKEKREIWLQKVMKKEWWKTDYLRETDRTVLPQGRVARQLASSSLKFFLPFFNNQVSGKLSRNHGNYLSIQPGICCHVFFPNADGFCSWNRKSCNNMFIFLTSRGQNIISIALHLGCRILILRAAILLSVCLPTHTNTHSHWYIEYHTNHSEVKINKESDRICSGLWLRSLITAVHSDTCTLVHADTCTYMHKYSGPICMPF